MNKKYTNILILLIVAISVVLYFGFNKTGFSQAADPIGFSSLSSGQPISDLPQSGICTGSFTVPATWAGYCGTDIAIVWGKCSNSDRTCQEKACNSHGQYYPGVCSWQNNVCEPTTDPGGMFQCSNFTQSGQSRCQEYSGCSWRSGVAPQETTISTRNMCAEIEKEYVDLKQRYDTLSEEKRKRFVLLGEKIATCVSSNPAQARSINATAEQIVSQICSLIPGVC